MKKLLMILVLGLILLSGVSVANAKNQVPWQVEPPELDEPIEEPSEPSPVVSVGSGGLTPGADQCKSDEFVVYSEWSDCQVNFRPYGLMFRQIIKTTNGCKPTVRQVVMGVKSCFNPSRGEMIDELYGTDWLINYGK